MPSTLPVANVPGGTPLNTTPDVVQPAVPAVWDDPQRVIRVVLEMYATDPAAATALWNEYRRLKYGISP